MDTYIFEQARQLLSVGVLMSLGTSDLKPRERGLEFTARILPFKANGERAARPVKMRCVLDLEWSDWYHISVSYKRGGEQVVHFDRDELAFTEVNGVLLALDYDGPEVLNPRYVV